MFKARRMVLFTAIALAAFLGCDGKPSIVITTALPIDAPPGQNERLLYIMCNDVGRHKNDHIKVIYVKGKGGVFKGRAFTQTPFCSEVMKTKYKPKGPIGPGGRPLG